VDWSICQTAQRFSPPIIEPSELREVTNNVVASIGALCQQEYSDEYAIRPTTPTHRRHRSRSS
jgi:hypothetical protein